MSNTFKLLEDRHHVVHYKEEVPPKEVVDKALWEAWKTSPSKNNAMPWSFMAWWSYFIPRCFCRYW